MGKLGKFWMGKFEENQLSLHEHLLEKKTFRIIRVLQETDPCFGVAEEKISPAYAKSMMEDYGGLLTNFLAYETDWQYPRLATCDGRFFELDPDSRKILKSDRHFGRSFGQDAIPPYYYIGTEDNFFKELGYELQE